MLQHIDFLSPLQFLVLLRHPALPLSVRQVKHVLSNFEELEALRLQFLVQGVEIVDLGATFAGAAFVVEICVLDAPVLAIGYWLEMELPPWRHLTPTG